MRSVANAQRRPTLGAECAVATGFLKSQQIKELDASIEGFEGETARSGTA
jgi:hypothetical protein